MFKMARKFLGSGGPSNSGSNINDAENNNPKKANRNKPQAAGGGGGELPAGEKAKTSGDEISDFSRLESDPRVPLTVREIFKIIKSWKGVSRAMAKTGSAMFLTLFEQNQDLFYLFDRFQHLKGQELHESMELKEHATTVMSTLDHSINSLSDYDNFVNHLSGIGRLHRKVPGFKREHFWKIEQPFMKAIKQTLDERCNETIEEIYKIAIKLIIETIAAGYGEDTPENSTPNASNKPAGSRGDTQPGGQDKRQPPPSGGDDNSKEGARQTTTTTSTTTTTTGTTTTNTTTKALLNSKDNSSSLQKCLIEIARELPDGQVSSALELLKKFLELATRPAAAGQEPSNQFYTRSSS